MRRFLFWLFVGLLMKHLKTWQIWAETANESGSPPVFLPIKITMLCLSAAGKANIQRILPSLLRTERLHKLFSQKIKTWKKHDPHYEGVDLPNSSSGAQWSREAKNIPLPAAKRNLSWRDLRDGGGRGGGQTNQGWDWAAISAAELKGNDDIDEKLPLQNEFLCRADEKHWWLRSEELKAADCGDTADWVLKARQDQRMSKPNCFCPFTGFILFFIILFFL